MSRTIDFCIPFIANGVRYLEHLIDNIERTATQPQRINFIVSYHTDDDLNALRKSTAYKKISQAILAPACLTTTMFRASANHASAINTLAKASSEDIVIFSDYDMAFVYPGWDKLIEHYFFVDNLQLCGVTYSCLWLRFQNQKLIEKIPIIKDTNLAKYQKLPNLSFFGIRGDVLRQTFSSQLTHFDEFLSSGKAPFRVIDTPLLATENNLPMGSVQWLDTGCELPRLIREKNIPYKIFPYVLLDQQNVLQDYAEYNRLNTLYRPEVFYCQPENVPFLCHFKKGTAKSENDDINSAFHKFTAAVDHFLKQAGV